MILHLFQFLVPGDYSWNFKGGPNLDASYFEWLNPDNDFIYRDLASLNHYFNLSGNDMLEDVLQIEAFAATLSTDEANAMLNFIWNLRILEDELTGECGSGAKNCSADLLTAVRRKRSVHSAWQSYNYQKVLKPGTS